MPTTYADILAGPIMRRVGRRTAAVWIALAKPAQLHAEKRRTIRIRPSHAWSSLP